MARFFMWLFLISVFFVFGVIFGLTLHAENKNVATDARLATIELQTERAEEAIPNEIEVEKIDLISEEDLYPIVKTASFLEKTVIFFNEKIIQLLYSFANLFF